MRFWFFLLIIITTKQDLFYSVFEIVFCFFKFFPTQSTSKNGTEIEAKTFFWVAPSPLWSENSRSIHRRSRGKASWMHRVCLGLESQTKIWKVRNVVPRLTWSGKLQRFRLVWKVMPRAHWFGKSRRICLGLKSRAISLLVWKSRRLPLVTTSAPRSHWSGKWRRLHLGPRNCFLVAPSLPWSGNLRPVRLGLEGGVNPALVWEDAPSPPWSGKSRRPHFGLESRAVSALVWKIAPRSPWFGRWGRSSFCLGNCTVFVLVWKALGTKSWKPGKESRQGSWPKLHSRTLFHFLPPAVFYIWRYWNERKFCLQSFFLIFRFFFRTVE